MDVNDPEAFETVLLEDPERLLTSSIVPVSMESGVDVGSVFSLLQVMHRVGSLEQIEANQYFELIEDPLLNMLIPMITKLSVHILKQPTIETAVATLTPRLSDCLICPMVWNFWEQAECRPNGAGANPPGSPLAMPEETPDPPAAPRSLPARRAAAEAKAPSVTPPPRLPGPPPAPPPAPPFDPLASRSRLDSL